MISITNKFKTFDIDISPYEYFEKLFDNEIKDIEKMYVSASTYKSNYDNYVLLKSNKIDWMDTITKRIYRFTHLTIKKSENTQYFNNFITFLDNELRNLGQKFIDIDICRFFIQKIQTNNNKFFNLSHHYVASLINRIYPLTSNDIIIRISSLFDKEYCNKHLGLTKRNNITSLIYDIKNKKNNTNVELFLDIILKLISKLNDEVNKYRKYVFNSCKHNFTNEAKDEEKSQGTIMKIEWQVIFNIWFVLINFILPVLKNLFIWSRDGKHYFILQQQYTYDDSLERIYSKLLKES